MTAPHHPTTPADGGAGRLRGRLGVPAIVFLVVAAAAPLTAIAGAMPVAFAIGNGAGLPGAYIVCALVLLVFSVGYAAMSRHVVDAGAFSAYVARGLGPRSGRGAAWLALLTYTSVQAAVYGLAGATTAGFIATTLGGPDLPWWLCAGVLLAVVGVLGFRNIDIGAKVLGVLLVVEMGIVALLIAGVLVGDTPEGLSLSPFTPSSFFSGSPGIAIMFAVASFIGFEATAIYGEEARDPQRAVPRATYAAVLFIGVFYAAAAWAVTLFFGPSAVQSVAEEQLPAGDLVFTVAGGALGGWAAEIMPVLLITSLFAALLAFHNAIARYLFSLGRSGGAPAALGVTHPRHASPHLGSLVQTATAALVVAAFAVAGADPVAELFTWLSGLAALAILVLMLVVSVAVLTFFARSRVDVRWWNTRLAPALGALGLALITVLVLMNFTTLIGGSTVLALLMVVITAAAFVLGGLLSPAAPRAAATPSAPSTPSTTSAPSDPGNRR